MYVWFVPNDLHRKGNAINNFDIMKANIDLSGNEKKLLAQGLKAIQASSQFKINLEKDIRMQNARRRRIATKFRQQLLKSAFKAANIDQAAIIRRQQLDVKSARNLLATLKPKVNEYARLVKEKHSSHITMLKTLARSNSLPRFLGGPPPPFPEGQKPEVIILNKADGISIIGGVAANNLSPWNNTLQLELTAHQHDAGVLRPPGPDEPELHLQFDFVFLFRPPRNGVLHAWSWVMPNGDMSYFTDSLCETIAIIDSGGWAWMTLQQPLPTINNQVEVPAQRLGPEWYRTMTYNCSSHSGIDIFSDLAAFETDKMELPVIANSPVQIVVSIALGLIAENGMCSFNFRTGSRQINVPAVFLNFM